MGLGRLIIPKSLSHGSHFGFAAFIYLMHVSLSSNQAVKRSKLHHTISCQLREHNVLYYWHNSNYYSFIHNSLNYKNYKILCYILTITCLLSMFRTLLSEWKWILPDGHWLENFERSAGKHKEIVACHLFFFFFLVRRILMSNLRTLVKDSK
jgi:hypothetical protein